MKIRGLLLIGVFGLVVHVLLANNMTMPVPYVYPDPAYLEESDSISIIIPEKFSQGLLSVDIYDADGKFVIRLEGDFPGKNSSAERVCSWKGYDKEAVRVASGMYFAFLRHNEANSNLDSVISFRIRIEL